jgi:arylsulfatase A-like enzyme
MSRLAFTLALVLVPCLIPTADAIETGKMNILFLDIEDCRADVWGCYGNPICKTPNVDRLAASGVRFSRAYCQYVCCNPSRSSFLTGLRPHTTGVLSNSHHSREHLPPGTKSLPQLIKAGGYYTANVAKLFHSSGAENEEDMRAFDRIEMQNRPSSWEGPPAIMKFPPVPRRSDLGPAPNKGTKQWDAYRRKRSDRYGDSGLTDAQEHDGRVAQIAAALLREFSEHQRHFFLSVGSSRPHTPLICPKKYIDMYDPREIPMPKAPRGADRGVPEIAVRFGRSADIFMSRKPTPQQTREAIAAYYACVTFLDTHLGVVLDALDQSGLADNTIVIFFSDHGFHLGEHGHWSKYTLFEQSTRVPMIVRVPGLTPAGAVCEEIVELVDLVPTIGELAGVQLPANLEGTSFAPLLADPQRPWKKGALTVFGNRGEHNSIRTKRFRYTEWQHKDQQIQELYDLETDPWETINLANQPSTAEKQQELAELLDEGWKALVPPETSPSDSSAAGRRSQ